MTLLRATFAGLVVLALVACARDRFAVTSRGSLPSSGSIAVAEPRSASAVLPLVIERLEARGLSRAGEPDYLVQFAEAGRSANAGVVVPDQSSDEWLRSPTPRRRGQVTTLVLTLTDRSTGGELYRAAVSVAGRLSEEDRTIVSDALLGGSDPDR